MNLEPQIFVGDSSDALARVYAALPRADLPADARLEGELVGPYCRHAKTLPARIRFADRGPGPTLLAEAIVPDPCFWTPDLPFLYTAELSVVSGNGSKPNVAIAAIERPFGIRRLGVQGASIHLDARRFVPRGVFRQSIDVADLKQTRETATALYVHDSSDEVLEKATEEGILLAVELHTSEPAAELARLGRWPAVAIVVLAGDVHAGQELRQAARNVLLAHAGNEFHGSTEPVPWAHLLWWQIEPGEIPTAAPPRNIPIIAYRPTTKNATIELGRRACDRLQADLAPLGDFAGYFT